jgi:dTDP-4-dehydrorhamnose 3,5-epimerase
MKVVTTDINGVFIIETSPFEDQRGFFVKTFNKDMFLGLGLETEFTESFYSLSKKDVIRGMHFHLPPKDHYKLIYVTNGSIIDVVLDLRKESATYGKHIHIELSQKNSKMIYIPVGCAHGFLSLEDNTCTVYMQTGMYSKEHDYGIHPLSFGMQWGVQSPILSERDKKFETLEEFKSPF